MHWTRHISDSRYQQTLFQPCVLCVCVCLLLLVRIKKKSNWTAQSYIPVNAWTTGSCCRGKLALHYLFNCDMCCVCVFFFLSTRHFSPHRCVPNSQNSIIASPFWNRFSFFFSFLQNVSFFIASILDDYFFCSLLFFVVAAVASSLWDNALWRWVT